MQCLDDLKILDFSTLLPGPFASLYLADLGAEVLKISSPTRVDLVLASPPFLQEGISANQAWLGRNKKTLCLDLKQEAGKKIVKELIADYDIVIEQFRPGVMQKLGLSYEELATINPRLIYCSITGYGQTGPYKERAGHDINFLALSGNMSYSGRKEGGPVLSNMQIADLAGGAMHAVIALLAAVHHREKTGEGQYLDISMLDAALSLHAMEGARFLATGKENEREDGLLNGGSFYDFYECQDGRFLSVASLEPKFWKSFCHCIHKEEWIAEGAFPKDVLEKKEELRSLFLTKPLEEWKKVFQEADCCVEPVLSQDEALHSEETRAREMLVEFDIEGRRVEQIASPLHFSKTPPQYRHPGKKLGADAKEILEGLGYSKEEIEEFKKEGVV